MADLSLVNQTDWKWCQKCQGLFYSLPNSGPTHGVCPAGGAHRTSPSLPYVVPSSEGVGISAIRTRRWLYRGLGRGVIHDFSWGDIRHDSYVLMTVAEARDSQNPPERFIGDAQRMGVYNIAPHDGGCLFIIWWEGTIPYLDVWVDVLLIH
jgi:hypothetical protein